MKLYCIIAFILLGFLLPAFADESREKAQEIFTRHVKENMTFTYVPRGLIVSLDDSIFFNEDMDKIKESGTCTLNEIAEALKEIDYVCVIEGHSVGINPDKSSFKTNWELSLARANNIAKYFMRCSKISPNKLVSIGYGELVPDKMSNRIDFVIMHYDEDR